MPTQSKKKLSRRDSLKLMSSAAAALLIPIPDKWSKPELNSGKLPEHAQTSGTGGTLCYDYYKWVAEPGYWELVVADKCQDTPAVEKDNSPIAPYTDYRFYQNGFPTGGCNGDVAGVNPGYYLEPLC